MRIVTTHAARVGRAAGYVHEFELCPICSDDGLVAGYDESVSLVDDPSGYSGRITLFYNARAIVWDGSAGDVDWKTSKAVGDFVLIPAKVMLKHTYGEASIYEIMDIPDEGIGIADVEDCLSIAINGKRRYTGHGRGSIALIVEEDDIDPLQLEKEYSSISTTAHIGQERIIEGELPNVCNEMYQTEAARLTSEYTYDRECIDSDEDEYDCFDLA